MSLHNLISNGGKILIVGGYSKSWKDYEKFSQLEFWRGDNPSEVRRHIQNKDIPPNCKGIIISRFISHSELNPILDEARKRGITLFPNKSDGEVSSLLDEMVRDLPKTEKIEKSRERGKLNQLIQFIDFSKTNVENARAIYIKAKELGITTTEDSLAQFVGVRRRKLSGTAVVKSVRSKLDLSVDMLDSMVKDLSGMRDYLIEITEENRILKKKLDKFKQALSDD